MRSVKREEMVETVSRSHDVKGRFASGDDLPRQIQDPSEPAETVMLRQAGEAMAEGLRLLKMERHAGALEALERAMYLWPDIKGLHRSRALCLRRLGRPKESEMAARAALGQDPADRQAAALIEAMAAERPGGVPEPDRGGAAPAVRPGGRP